MILLLTTSSSNNYSVSVNATDKLLANTVWTTTTTNTSTVHNLYTNTYNPLKKTPLQEFTEQVWEEKD